MKPTWVKFQAEFLDYVNYPDSGAVKTLIGGGIDADSITNTCAIRLSRGLNESGVPLPARRNGLLTVRGGDKKYYALRVAEMRIWLPLVLGKPDLDHRKKAGTAFDSTSLSALKGIIAFDIRFSDATGHLDSWDGSTFSSEYKVSDYWTPATRITLWSLN